MRKEEIRSLVLYTIIIAVAIIAGFAFVRPQMEQYGPGMNGLLFIIVVILVSYLVNVIGLELLHVLGAVLGGYSITGFNILGLCFYKKEKTWKFGLRDFNGISGETKIAPKKEKTNPNWNIWFPLFGFAIELASCIVVSMLVKGSNGEASWLIPASTIFILISSMIAFYNLIPLKLDSMTDGYKLRLFANQINVQAYNHMLVIQEKKRLGEKIEEVPVFDEITEYTAEINMMAMYIYLEQEKYEDAIKIIDNLIEHKKILNFYESNRMIAQRLYLEILTKPVEEAKKLYDELCPTEIRRFIANDNSMPCIRAYILIAGMIEESESEVEYAKQKVEKAKKKSLKSEIATEEKLLEKALDFVYSKHPKWKKEKENSAN